MVPHESAHEYLPLQQHSGPVDVLASGREDLIAQSSYFSSHHWMLFDDTISRDGKVRFRTLVRT
jgi:hypothetical protein